MIGVIDTQRCNLASVILAIERLNLESEIVATPAALEKCSKLILPGVGNFGTSLAYLRKTGLDDAIINAVVSEKTPILGICLGMQLLFSQSDEAPDVKGLSLLPGDAKLLPLGTFPSIPHIGWEYTEATKPSLLFPKLSVRMPFYFSHSYHCVPEDRSIITSFVGETNICAAVQKGHIFGVQFHPEKSHEMGLHTLRNFLEVE